MLLLLKRGIIVRALKVLSFLLLLFLGCGAVALEDKVCDLKSSLDKAIQTNNVRTTIKVCEEIEELVKTRTLEKSFDIQKIEATFNARNLDTRWIERIKDALQQGLMTPKQATLNLLYPYNLLLDTYRTSFEHLNFSFKYTLARAAIMRVKEVRILVFFSEKSNKDLKKFKFKDADEALEALSCPLVCESAFFVNAAKEFMKELEGAAQTSQLTPFQTLNMGYLSKINNNIDQAEKFFNMAAQMRIKRASIELSFCALEKNTATEIRRLESLSDAYSFWKAAQIYRYGMGIERNLKISNDLYLRAIEKMTHMTSHIHPEIYYDAGDFATYYALNQKIPTNRLKALKSARAHYHFAGEQGMAEGYFEEIKTLKRINDIEAISNIEIDCYNLAREVASLGEFSKVNKYASVNLQDGQLWAQYETDANSLERFTSGVKEYPQ